MKDSLDLALALVSDVAMNPAFAQDEIDRQKQQMLSGLKVSFEDPDYIAGVVFDRLVYGLHPYGRSPTSRARTCSPTIASGSAPTTPSWRLSAT